VLAAAPALLFHAAAQARPLTTAPTLVLTVNVAITDAHIVLDHHRGPRGIEARFVIKNEGARAHNFTFKATKAAAGVQAGFSRTLEPHKQAVVRVFLDFRTKVPYFDGLPADRRNRAMRGTFTIT
jgi:hypothetical protein